jgi:hypothetical protein
METTGKRILCGALGFLLPLASLSAQSRGLKVISEDGITLTAFSKSYALVIGESNYTKGWPKLDGVKDDISAVKTLFEEQGFVVELVEDATSQSLSGRIGAFLNNYGYDDDVRLVVYYAGHGHTLDLGGRDMGYIVPVDAPDPARDRSGFMRLAIPMQQFDTWAKMITSRHVLFMFDSCFSGSVFAMSRASPGIIDYKIANPVRQFIASGAANETVPDKSIFRRQLETALRDREADLNHDGYVSGSELGDFLQTTVVNYSYNAQHPQYGKIRDPGLDKGDFVFEVGRTTVVVQEKSPADVPVQTRISGGDLRPGDGARDTAKADSFTLDRVNRWGIGASYTTPLGFDAKFTVFESYKDRGTFSLLPNSYFISAAYFSGNEFGTSDWEAKSWSLGIGVLYQIRLDAGQRFLLHFGPSVNYDMGTAAYTGPGAGLYDAEFLTFDIRGIAAEALGGIAFRFTPALSLGLDAVFHAGNTLHFAVNAGLRFHQPYK